MSTTIDPVLVPPSMTISDPTEPTVTSSDGSTTSASSSAYNYFFLIIAFAGILIFVLLLYFAHRRRHHRKSAHPRNQSTGRSARVRDIESLGGTRSTPYWGRLGRSNDEILEAGLNERGEAPPDYRHAISGIDKEISVPDTRSQLQTDSSSSVNNAGRVHHREANARSGVPLVMVSSQAEVLRRINSTETAEHIRSNRVITRVISREPPRYQELEGPPTNTPILEMLPSPNYSFIQPLAAAVLSARLPTESMRVEQSPDLTLESQLPFGAGARSKWKYMRHVVRHKWLRN